MKLLIDMNFSPLWEDFFAASHIEAVHWSAGETPSLVRVHFWSGVIFLANSILHSADNEV
jgi:hypothetical protein